MTRRSNVAPDPSDPGLPDPCLPDLRLNVSRLIKAPREQVFAAWTTPEFFGRWIAPKSLTSFDVVIDPKVGGEFSVGMRGNIHGKVQSGKVYGRYLAVDPPHKLRFSWLWSLQDFPETEVEVTFQTVEGGTLMALSHSNFVESKTCENHKEGWINTFDKLEAALAQKDVP